MVEKSNVITDNGKSVEDGTRVGNEQQTERILKFSIENILRPEFGTKHSSNTSVQEEKQVSSSSEQTVWPAWVYCTRYSDRPSSGKAISIIFLNYGYSLVI
ncbi:hypothetical protein O3M35_010142 [Rhynocoris fuscipes]|uniref:Uncharacterized protein n=1 Tax=Rhynocoris fuscipes TaxID=488301 RepID=A0AAW1D408_9HEMI